MVVSLSRTPYAPVNYFSQPEPSVTQLRKVFAIRIGPRTGRRGPELIKTVVEADNTALSTRIAALILLLDGTPVSKISERTLDDVDTTPTRTTITLGDLPGPVPEALLPLFHQHLADRGNHRTMNRHCPWLFPGTRAGQHIPNNHSCIAAAFRHPSRPKRSTA